MALVQISEAFFFGSGNLFGIAKVILNKSARLAWPRF
jgi:hypothetical protein